MNQNHSSLNYQQPQQSRSRSREPISRQSFPRNRHHVAAAASSSKTASSFSHGDSLKAVRFKDEATREELIISQQKENSRNARSPSTFASSSKFSSIPSKPFHLTTAPVPTTRTSTASDAKISRPIISERTRSPRLEALRRAVDQAAPSAASDANIFKPIISERTRSPRLEALRRAVDRAAPSSMTPAHSRSISSEFFKVVPPLTPWSLLQKEMEIPFRESKLEELITDDINESLLISPLIRSRENEHRNLSSAMGAEKVFTQPLSKSKPLLTIQTTTNVDTTRNNHGQCPPSVHNSSIHRVMASQWRHSTSASSHSSITTPASNSKETTSIIGGICLDLSNMFCNVESHSKQISQNRPSCSVLPSSTAESSIEVIQPQKRPPISISDTKKLQSSIFSTSAPEADTKNSSSELPSTQPQQQHEDWCITQWLNYLLVPEATHSSPPTDMETNAEISTTCPLQPSAIQTLRAHQHLASTRLKGLALFQSISMKQTRQKIQREILSGRIALRKDKNIAANVNERDRMLDLLFQYATPWLRLGLETLFGQVILPFQPHDLTSPQHQQRHRLTSISRTDNGNISVVGKGLLQQKPPLSLKRALRGFITQRLLLDEPTLAKYSKRKCAVPSGRFEVEYQAELRSIVLFRLLILFLFLDAAKEAQLIDHVTLFRRDSVIKSTRDILISFCCQFLASQGNIIKFLGKMGIKVSHRQEPLDEIDFTISNIALDLKDGIRLVRVAEILTGASPRSLLSKCRIPAKSRLQKFHNIKVAMDHLHSTILSYDKAMPEDRRVVPRHVLDGHRAFVMRILWMLAAHCCLDTLVNVEEIRIEIEKLERLYRPQKIDDSQVAIFSNSLQDLRNYLFRWCCAVTRSFGLNLTNLTTDFCDGKAFCYVISYYHPLLLRARQIKSTTRDLDINASENDRSLAILNEQSNGKLANAKMNELGGLSKMIPLCDSTCPPDENMVILCLSYLWSRLMETKGEIRSSVVIQSCYRRYRNRILWRRKLKASRLILHAWRTLRDSYFQEQRRRYKRPVMIIERFVATHRIRLTQIRKRRLDQETLKKLATILQACARRFLARLISSLLLKEKAVVLIQAHWRGFKVVSDVNCQKEVRLRAAGSISKAWKRYLREQRIRNDAAVAIQRYWRQFWAIIQECFLIMDVKIVQCLFRKRMAVRELQKRREAIRCIQRFLHYNSRRLNRDMIHQRNLIWNKAAVVIQRYWRRFWAIIQGHFLIIDVTIVQCLFRKRMAIRELQQRREASRTRTALLLQSVFRGYLLRNHLKRLNIASRRIQAIYRSYLTRMEYTKVIFSIQMVQANARRRIMTKNYTVVINSITLIQGMIRKMNAHKEVRTRRDAVVTIQSLARRLLSSNTFIDLQQQYQVEIGASVAIQCRWRGIVILRNYLSTRVSVIQIQRQVRRFQARQLVIFYKKLTLLLQRNVRRYLAMQRVFHMRAATECERRRNILCASRVQRLYRGYLVRRELTFLHTFAVMIQRFVRMRLAWLNFQMDRVDIIVAQTLVRKWIAERKQYNRRAAIVLIQALYRRHIARKETAKMFDDLSRLIHQNVRATIIQSRIRGNYARRRATQEEASRLIQKTWRCFSIHVDYILCLLAVLRIQNRWRMCLAVQIRRTSIRSAVMMSALARGFLKRKDYRRSKMSIVTIQSVYRCFSARWKFQLCKLAALIIQSCTRGLLVRSSFLRMAHMACSIQRVWRGYATFRDYVHTVVAVVDVQRGIRSFLAKSYVRRLLLNRIMLRLVRLRCSLIIQRRFRQHQQSLLKEQAARSIQDHIRCYILKLAFIKKRHQIVRCQSLFRGWRVRQNSSRTMRSLALRVEVVNLKAKSDPRQRLFHRTKEALEALLKIKRLAALHAAICTLETATRFSAECCNSVVEADACQILFVLIRNCNRSVPHLELLHNILCIMTNLARYERSHSHLATATGVEVFLDLVQMFRDKDSIFCLSSRLLELVVRYDSDLKSVCGTIENSRRLNSVVNVHLRKITSFNSTIHASYRPQQQQQMHHQVLKRRSRVGRGSSVSVSHLPKTFTSSVTCSDPEPIWEGIRALQRVIQLIDCD